MKKAVRVLFERRAIAASVLTGLTACLLAAPAFGQGDGSAKMRDIKPFIGYSDTFQWSDIPEILQAGAKGEKSALDYAWASDLFFEKEIWQLDFRYKNIRTIDVDFPTADGNLETRRVWYLVYSVTNTGERLRAVVDEEMNSVIRQSLTDENTKGIAADENVNVSEKVITTDDKTGKVFEFPRNNIKGVFKPEKVVYDGSSVNAKGIADGSISFAPRFVFAAASIKDPVIFQRKGDLYVGQTANGEEAVYYDTVLPLAFAQIVKREGRGNMEFYDTARIASRVVKPGETVWGVATWVGVDPRIDKFSIYISGLTNALHWEITDDVDPNLPGSGRDIRRKVLKVNFFNPGDEAHRGGKEIYNILPGELDYQWIYL